MSRTRKIVALCAIAVMLVAITYIVVYLTSEDRGYDVYKDLQNQVILPPEDNTPDDSPDTTPEQPPDDVPDDQDAPDEPPVPEEPEQEPYVSPLDFDTIREPNEDIYAWMAIPDTDIQYPVVQHPTDDSYYLDHTIEGRKQYPGSIYTESWNAEDFSDFLTVVYGHNMKNGTMFGQLRKFRSKDYMAEHEKVSFYTPTGEYHYRLFAAVTYSNAYLPAAYDYSTPEGRQAFIDSILSIRDLNSYVNKDIEVTPEDRLVVLSTCMGNDSCRLLVIGVLDKEASTR